MNSVSNPFVTQHTSIFYKLKYLAFGFVMVFALVAVVAPHLGSSEKVEGAQAAAIGLAQEMHKPEG